MKKRLAFAVASAVVAFGSVLPSTASAQRVIEETLILRDPTVSSAGNWLIGAAAEIWYINGQYNITDNAGNKLAEGDIKYKQPGFNIYAGYGDFTVLVTSRSGDGTLDLAYEPGVLAASGFGQFLTTSKVEQEDREIVLRWIFLKRQHFAPYVVAGYSWTDYQEDETMVNQPTFVWTATGTRTRRETIEYTAPLIGIGAIIPMTERIGFRLDARAKFYSAERTRSGRANDSGSGVGGDVTGTAYANIFFEGLNVQVGGRYTHLNAGDAGGSVSRLGWFGMLGYTHRF